MEVSLDDAKKEALENAERTVAELLHGSQKSKHPFTVEELMEKHLTKVG
jgi:hypothetical protein